MHVFTVGHSNHVAEHFLALIEKHAIDVLVDVRSWPHSRHTEWADVSTLPATLRSIGCRYVFLGEELGGRPSEAAAYTPDGRVRYSRVAASHRFRAGIERLSEGLERFRVAMMCSEENPEGCHRRLLVGKVLIENGVTIDHIRADGRLEREMGVEPPHDVLFVEEDDWWTSTRSVSHRARRETSSAV